MLVVLRSGQFRRDVKRKIKRGKDLAKLCELLELLIEDKPLPVRTGCHADFFDAWPNSVDFLDT